ncbi:phage portal protein [Guggenheimella bovis]
MLKKIKIGYKTYDIIIVESERIDNVTKLRGLLSTESLLAQLPMVDDVQLELKRIEEERAKEEARFMGFKPPQAVEEDEES